MIKIATVFTNGDIEYEPNTFDTLEAANKRAKELTDYFAQFGGYTMVVD